MPDHLICLLRKLYAGQEMTIRTRHEQLTSSKLGKEYKSVYCHLAYLTYMQMYVMGNARLKLESRLPGKISATSDMQMIPL